MSRFGFKELDQSNWLQQDFVLKAFVRVDPDQGPVSMATEDWLKHILAPQLSEAVPDDVQALFEVARGAMAYGYFFYPLYTLSAEQLFRVAESAAKHRCRQLEAPSTLRSLAERIRWLFQQGEFEEQDRDRWDATRQLRNAASHPDRQSIITPGNAIGSLETVARLINSLFRGA